MFKYQKYRVRNVQSGEESIGYFGDRLYLTSWEALDKVNEWNQALDNTRYIYYIDSNSDAE